MDRRDPAVGDLRRHHRRVREVRAGHVAGVASAARDLRPGLPPGKGRADGPARHGATSMIAATMFWYAPQRHRFPLIRSRISA